MPTHSFTLLAQLDAARVLARLFSYDSRIRLYVRDAIAFKEDTWLPLGEIELFPPSTVDHDGRQPAPTIDDPLVVAMYNGAYVWRVPTALELTQGREICMPGLPNADKPLAEAVQDCCRRLLLTYPTFDPETLSSWPPRRPLTIVPDTSSVLQGALDFVSRYLCPMARVKVPAVVSLEILNMADRFFTFRRHISENVRVPCLREHTKSQGAQRALLRIELMSDTEVERPIQGSDPIRMIYQPESEKSIKNLNLTEVNRSLADRLVFESAKEHQSRLTAAHPICVLTSDQGLARMALCEGMAPVYFDARKSSDPLGRTLTGAMYHPLKPELSAVSLTSVMWELATSFGSVRAESNVGTKSVEVTAIGDGLAWYPYQSKDDLLWCTWNVEQPHVTQVSPMADTSPIDVPIDDVSEILGIADSADGEIQSGHIVDTAVNRVVEETAAVSLPNEPDPLNVAPRILAGRAVSAYVFSPAKMFSLMGELDLNGVLSTDAAAEILKIKPESVRDYRSFLASGNLIHVQDELMYKTDSLALATSALRNANVDGLATSLNAVPSFQAFTEFVEQHGRDPKWREHCWVRRSGALRALESLTELSGVALDVPGVGVIRTDRMAEVDEFTSLAAIAFEELAGDEEFVLTGAWLEHLSINSGIHPVRTRRLLETANARGSIHCLVEGSTPDTRFDDHNLDVLTVSDGTPEIRRYHLYRGDFLLPNRAAVRMRIERPES